VIEHRKLDLIHDLPIAAFATDTEGRVIRYNAAALAFWGREPAVDALWTGAIRLLTAAGETIAHAESPAARTLREGQPPAGPSLLFVERPDGSEVAFLSRPSIVHGDGHRIVGVLELMLDPDPRELIDLAAVRMAAIVSSSYDPVIGQSLDGRITSWNEGATRMFGWRRDEMIGESILRMIPPELRHEEEHAMAALTRGERLEPFSTERLTKDGRRIAVSLAISPIRSAAGRLIGASKIARDIIVHRSGGEPQSRLVEDLNHRVRNTLATIQAIAGQSLRLSHDPGSFTRSFAGRVQALARMHDLLVANDMAGADLSAIVRAQLPATGSGLRVGVEGPAVMLEPRVAVQMALVLHELADNARRHGALAGTSGRVTVEWSIEAKEEGMRLVFDWRERGSAIASVAEATPRYGFLFIERSLAVNGGTAARRHEPGGLAWHIELPLPGLPAALPDAPPGRPNLVTAIFAESPLKSCRVLVVEDEPLIALEMESELSDAGACVLGPLGTTDAALRLIATEPLQAALLDATLAGEPTGALAGALDARGVPFAFTSGHGRSALPSGFSDRPLLGKPFKSEELVAVVSSLIVPAHRITVVPLGRLD
jgi:PAS domain S-box-containing protein